MDSPMRESASSPEKGDSVSSLDPTSSKRGRTGRIGRGRSRSDGGGRGRGGRGRGGRGRGGRSRGGRVRKGGRLHQADAARIKALKEDRKKSVEENIANMTEQDVRGLLATLVQRQPGLVFDVLEASCKGGAHKSSSEAPGWCICLNCPEMPTDLEKVCCGMQPDNCISERPEMDLLVLDPQVINLGNLYRAEVFAAANNQDNAGMRHGAYRQFILWRHGRLGQGIRRVIPACCVKKIRESFPSPNGIYAGFIPGRLI